MRCWSITILALGLASGAVAAEGLPPPRSASPSPSPSAAMMPAGSSSPSPQLSGVKKAEPAGWLGGHWYSTVELRHHINTYYDEQGALARQEPSLHARLQVGTQLYDGLVDAYATVGVFKQPKTQQVMQRRPELAVDLYPVKNDYFTLLQYNILQLPVRTADAGTMTEDEKEDYSESTVTMVGLAPLATWPLISGASKLALKAGLDGWTKLYSRKQYAGENKYSPIDEDDDEGHLDLTSGAPAADTDAPIEDYAMHYQNQAMTGVSFSPAFAHSLTVETTVHYDSRFDPVYTRHADGGVDYRYGVERYSYYQLRLHYDITDRVALTNDFYHFHEGFFAGQRKGEDERRFRNIARISCRM